MVDGEFASLLTHFQRLRSSFGVKQERTRFIAADRAKFRDGKSWSRIRFQRNPSVQVRQMHSRKGISKEKFVTLLNF